MQLNSSASSELQTPALADETQITLQVGEQRFITTRETLTERNQFFDSLLSDRWDNKQADGSYFIDADATLFSHILSYLRRGILPIFYTKSNGHDHALYHALLQEAKYFQIPRLEKYLQAKEYLKAVKLETRVEVEDWTELYSLPITPTNGMEDIEFYPAWHQRKVYICPRGITVHRGNPQACGRQCKNAQGDEPEYDEEAVLKVAIVRKSVTFSPVLCVDENSVE